MKEIILIDDSIPVGKPEIIMPEVEEKQPVKPELKIVPKENKTQDIILLVVFIVLMVGIFIFINYMNKQKGNGETSV